MPENAVSVTRPGQWGNPFKVGDPHPGAGMPIEAPGGPTFPSKIKTTEEAVACFRLYAMGRASVEPSWLDPLRGKDLACFCPMHQPCHADVLISIIEHIDKWREEITGTS